jgi:hypothetical protein
VRGKEEQPVAEDHRGMSEAELLKEFTTLGQTFLTGVQAAFTIGSAYIIALYTFLGRAPFLLKVTAFAFFSVTMLVLGVFMLAATRYADGVAAALTDLHVRKKLSGLGGLVTVMLNHTLTYVFVGISILMGIGVYFALYYLTFHFEWPA